MVFSRKILILMLTGFLFGMCTKEDDAAGCTPTHDDTIRKMNGISLVAPRDSISETDLAPLFDVQPNWVSLMPFGFMRSDSPELRYNVPNQWWGEREAGVRCMTEMLHKQNIKVMLKPQIWVYDINLYTGFIEMGNESDWKKLEEDYRSFALFYAQLAQQLNIEMYCIGTELEKFVTSRPEFWKQLIAEIRTVYSGKLTYASNWDEYKRVGFWDEVDYIGVDAYFPVSEEARPTKEDIIQGWQTHINTLKTFSENHQKQILFTEYGYRSMDYCGKEPWDSGSGYETNMQNQVSAYDGFFESVYQQEWMSGGFIWKWFTDHPNSGGITNNRFTMQNKPAQERLKHHFSLN